MTFLQVSCFFVYGISTHMPLARHDVLRPSMVDVSDAFLLTCLLRGMTTIPTRTTKTNKFLLTCLLRGMTRSFIASRAVTEISTHMPLARHDIYD